jgi:hypothetical protein
MYTCMWRNMRGGLIRQHNLVVLLGPPALEFVCPPCFCCWLYGLGKYGVGLAFSVTRSYRVSWKSVIWTKSWNWQIHAMLPMEHYDLGHLSHRLIILLFFFSYEVRLRPLGTTGLLYQHQMIDDDDCGAIGGIRIGRGNRSTRRKPTEVPLCPPQISHDLSRARTRAAAVGSRRLTAWAMARPSLPD